MTSSVFSLMRKYSQLWCKYIKIYVIYIYISHCLSTDWSCILVNNAGENLLFISFIYYIPTDWRSFPFYKRSLTHFSSSLIPGSELRSGSSCGTNCLPGRHRTDFHNLPVSPQTASKPQTGVDRTPVFKCTRRIPWYTEPHTDVSLGNCWAVMCVHGFVLWSSSADGIETQFKPWWRSLLCESDAVFLHVVLCWFSLVYQLLPFTKSQDTDVNHDTAMSPLISADTLVVVQFCSPRGKDIHEFHWVSVKFVLEFRVLFQ